MTETVTPSVDIDGAVEYLRALIRIPSVNPPGDPALAAGHDSRGGETAAARYCAEVLTGAGIATLGAQLVGVSFFFAMTRLHRGPEAAALRIALTMPPGEQRDRMRSMRSLIQEFNVYRWAGRMLLDASVMRRRTRVLRHGTDVSFGKRLLHGERELTS